MDATNLADLYGLAPLDWARVARRLDAGFPQAPGSGGPNRHTCWLSTINADGSPHVTGVGALWVDGSFWFETGPSTRKARNLARDRRCAVSLATDDLDVIVEGDASRISDPAVVARMAERWTAAGWPATVDATGTALTAPFSAPSAGPPPWWVFQIRARTVTAVATGDPGGATRWSS